MARSDSFSPVRKVQILEVASNNSNLQNTGEQNNEEETHPELFPENQQENIMILDKEDLVEPKEILSNQTNEVQEVTVVTKDPAVSELPETVKQFVSEGSKEAHSIPNGSCLIGTTALHTTGDHDQTKPLARDSNTHIASYREYYLQKVQADFPLTLTIGTEGKKKHFKKGEEDKFFDWLVEAEEAVYIWRGCVDIVALTNLLQIDVDCIVYQEGTMPEVKHFCPDPEFPWKEDDQNKPKSPRSRNYPKMTILNYKDVHFSLVVDKDSMIAQSGTFGFQRRMAEKRTRLDSIPEQEESVKYVTHNEPSQQKEMHSRIEVLEKALAEYKAENECLKKKLMSNQPTKSGYKEKESYNCQQCNMTCNDENELINHMGEKHFTYKYSCPEC